MRPATQQNISICLDQQRILFSFSTTISEFADADYVLEEYRRKGIVLKHNENVAR